MSRKQIRHVIKYTIFEVVTTVLMTIQGSCVVTTRRLFSSRYGVTSKQTWIFNTTFVGIPPKKTVFLALRGTIYDSKFGDCAAFPRGVPNFALGSNIPCFQQAALYPTPLYPDIWTWSPVRPSKLSSFPAWTGGLSCPVQVMEPSHLLAEGTEENSLLGYTTVTLRTFSGPTEAGRPSSLIFFFWSPSSLFSFGCLSCLLSSISFFSPPLICFFSHLNFLPLFLWRFRHYHPPLKIQILLLICYYIIQHFFHTVHSSWPTLKMEAASTSKTYQ